MPTVSVILPVFNRAALIQRAVRSVLEQSMVDLELIVVDDGSRDATGEQLAQITDPRLRVETLPENRGAAAARNRGVAMARGEWLAFQDSDDLWLPRKLEEQLAVAEQGAELVLCSYLAQQGERQWTIAPHAVLAGRDPTPDLLDGWPIITPTWLVRRQNLLAAGGFDESLSCLEDWDLILRLSREGRILATGHQPLLVKHHSSDTISADPSRLAPALEKILSRHAERWQGHSGRLARRLTHLGCLQRQLGQQVEARESLWRAVKVCPAGLVPLWLWLASYLPGRVFRRLERRWPTFTSMALAGDH